MSQEQQQRPKESEDDVIKNCIQENNNYYKHVTARSPSTPIHYKVISLDYDPQPKLVSPDIGKFTVKKEIVLEDLPVVNSIPLEVGEVNFPVQVYCQFCETKITTMTTYKTGKFLCCFLIPFFRNDCKDTIHSCPICKRVLHIQRKTCD